MRRGAPGAEETAAGEPPPTVIVRHRKERRSKCTLEPLVGRSCFRFFTYPLADVPALPGYVRLAIDGPPLTRADAARGILLLDATWRLLEPMTALFQHIEPRSLPRLRTAYPRASKLFEDPAGGLASIEALYVAHRIVGRPCEDLLAGYRGAQAFLEANREALAAIDRGR